MNLTIPVLLMLSLTMIVWVALYATRIPWFVRSKIDVEKASSFEKLNALGPPEQAQNIANNFKNLFEAPIVFYVISILMITTLGANNFDVIMGYSYVGMRAIHSLIQCTYNRVMHRFIAYLISSFALMAMLVSAFLSAI